MMHTWRGSDMGISAAAALCVAAGAFATGPSFTPLGDLPGGHFHSEARAVNADGSVVAGVGSRASSLCPNVEAFRWTPPAGMVGLGDLPGGMMIYSIPAAVSANGGVVVGTGRYSGPDSDELSGEAFVWSAAGGMVGLGDLPGGTFESAATGVSADGTVVVGTGNYNSSPSGEAFRWTAATGMVGLGDLPGGLSISRATRVNAGGTVVVGNSFSELGCEAFRWTAAAGMVGLGDLPGGGFMSGARAVSADGSVVVGVSRSDAGLEAFRWTAATGMVGLGDLPGGSVNSLAKDVSADGRVVVGIGTTGSSWSDKAFIWTEATGMMGLKEHLMALGATGLTGWMLSDALAISADGSTIVGVGMNPQGQTEAWVVRLRDSSAPPLAAAMAMAGVVTEPPDAGPGCDADFTCDGNADQDDVGCIINAVAGNPECACQDPDFNRDGNVDQEDVAALIGVVAGGDCP